MALDNIPTLGPGGFNGNLDKVLVYKNGGSEVACSLLTLTNSALNIAGVYLDPVNQRVGIYNPSPSAMLSVGSFGKVGEIALHRAIDGGQLALLSAQNGGLVISGGGQVLTMTNNYTNSIGTTQFAVSGAMWGIKGSGSTSATTSLLVQNSSGTQLGYVDDSGQWMIGTGTNGGFKLDVNGTARVSSFIDCRSYGSFRGDFYVYQANGAGGFSITQTAGQSYLIGQSSHDMIMGKTAGYSFILNNTNRIFGMDDTTSVAVTNASALLTMTSTTKGFLPPRLTTSQKNAIATPAAGLMVYDTDLNRPCFYSGSAWVTL